MPAPKGAVVRVVSAALAAVPAVAAALLERAEAVP